MAKPVMNLDAVVFDDVEENGLYTSSRAAISNHIGARKLGYNLTILPVVSQFEFASAFGARGL